jgi:hypothetical protein
LWSAVRRLENRHCFDALSGDDDADRNGVIRESKLVEKPSKTGQMVSKRRRRRPEAGNKSRSLANRIAILD